MPNETRRIVYSTDPQPERAPSESTPTAPRNPAAPYAIQGNNTVYVHRERKGRGGKTVSVIKGVRSPLAGKKALLKHLKNNLGTGGVISDDDIEIQGEQRARIVALLTELGYRAKVAGG